MSSSRRTRTKQDRAQHFIQGIGDGGNNLRSDFDLPDPDRKHYIRIRGGSRHQWEIEKRKRPHSLPNDMGDDLERDKEEVMRHPLPQPEEIADGGKREEVVNNEKSLKLGRLVADKALNGHIAVGDVSLEFMAMIAIFVLLLLAVVLFLGGEVGRKFLYKKKVGSDRKLQRTESQALRNKKKTDDEWEEELDTEYRKLVTRRQSMGKTGVFHTSTVLDPSSPCCYNRENFLRTENARLRKVAGVVGNNNTITTTAAASEVRNVVPVNASYHDVQAQDNAFRRMQVCSFDHDELDEEALSPLGRSRTFSFDEMSHGASRKPIYVSSFSELTMPDLSIHAPSHAEDNLSISDGNAKFFHDDDAESAHSNECANSGETEGANGVLHKRKDLTSCSDAASSLHSPIAYSDLKMNRLIGGGGFGQVWSATWRGTPVAVKVLSASSESLIVQKAILQEFVAEINMLSGMRHPNVCLYIGACLEPTNRAIVTELAANGSLWDALRLPLKTPFASQEREQPVWPRELYTNSVDNDEGSEGRMDPPQGTWPWSLVRRVAEGAARGMNYLHCGKPAVLHRDLKSANILLDDSYNPKVCDFGLSRIKTHENSMTANCGTVQWMAPEILANEPYAEPADVYSYGIILWELLTRQCPYDGMNSIQCALAVLNKDLRPEIPHWCPSSFASLIRQCIDKEPSNRPTFTTILSKFETLPN